MSQARIRSAFEKRLSGWAKPKGLPVLWQNVSGSVPAVDHLRAYLLPATTTARDIAGVNRSYTGIFQVSVFVLAGTGLAIAESLARELDDLFPVAVPILSMGLNVYVLTPMSARNAIHSDQWCHVPVDCRYGAEEVKS